MAMTDTADGVKAQDDAFLVPLLFVLTFVAGTVDAVSILRLGHIFVANMTGNIVFLGFGLAGATGFSVSASLVALIAFLAGAGVGARVLRAGGRSETLRRAALAEAALAAAATVVALSTTGTGPSYAITVLLAIAMGTQNAIVPTLAVPDLATTTVFTRTLTGLVVDRPDLSSPHSRTRRRAGTVAAIFAGAVVGTLLVIHASTGAALGLTTVLLVAVAAATVRRRTDRSGKEN